MELQKRVKREQLSESDSDLSSAPGSSASSHSRPPIQQQLRFQECVEEGSRAIKKGDFARAIRMYTDALELDPHNHLVFSNRSVAHIKMKQFDLALQDARKAKALKPTWPKVYLREAVALQCLAREAEAMASYASGLVHDAKNKQLLQGLVNAAAQSKIKHKFTPIYSQLEKMHLDDSPFVVISVIGQELLSAGSYASSLTVLECALRIGTCSLKLRGSVFSALSSAHWALGNIDKAIACMQQDLAVAKSLGDQDGECRAHGNLGAAYFSKGSYKEAIQHHRAQLILAMRLKDPKLASIVLSLLGHDYFAICDYQNALASHLQSVRLVKQSSKNRLLEAREIGNVGAVYLAMDECQKALECHHEHLKIAKQVGDKFEEARAYSNLGSAYHFTREYQQAVQYHNQVLNIAKDIKDRTLEARAFAGLGHACRCMQNWSQARFYHEQQLNNALQTKDKVAEGRSCSNLGIIYHQLGEHEAALKLHKAHLKIAKDLGDRASQGRAYGNIGNAYSALEQYEVAIRFHKQELTISKEVGDKHSECSTHGNLAVAYQALKIDDKALYHYQMHLQMSKQLKDTHSEARALSNLGNYHSSLKQYIEAIPLYEQYLALSQEIQDTEGEGKACHKLGYVHYCLGNYREAIRYYEQDLALAKDLQDKSSMCRAYCNLGLAHKALGDYSNSLECQKYFLATSHMTKSLAAKFCALGNIGDVLLKLNDIEEAIQMFNQQLQIAKQCKERKLEATAYGNLGAAHRILKQLDKALAYHNQELTIYQELNEVKGECKAHGHLGNVHMSLGNYTNAVRCYEEMLDRGRELKDTSVEAHAYGNLGLAHMNLGHFDDAIGLFEQQLAMLEQFNTHQTKIDRGRAFGNLGDCYESLGDYEEAVKCYEQYLAIAQNTNSIQDQDKAYRGLGNSHKALGNLQQSLVCFEKRLYVTHEMDRPAAKSSAYGELGCLHSLLGNFEQAISCLQNQLKTAQLMGDNIAEGEAVCGLGGVYQQMGEYDQALNYHKADLELALHTQNMSSQCRAFGNLGLSYESLGDYDDAIRYQEQHLNISIQMSDNIAKTLAFSSLGRVHHAMGNYTEAIRYLKEGLNLAEQFNRKEDEAKIRHRLGLALWGHGDLEDAQGQLYRATDLFESIRREAQLNNDYKLSMFDLQTASYQVLQRVLVTLGRHEEALVVAERGRTRAFVDFLLERQKLDNDTWYQSIDSTPVTKEQILDTVAKQQASVLYYSLAAGHLYTWLITPDKGIVKFHESSIGDLETGSDPEDTQSIRSLRSMGNTSLNGSVLDGIIGHVRESLGVESQLSTSRPSLTRSSLVMSETESEADDIWQAHVDELHDKLNGENDRTGFLRMVNRNHMWNASSYSLNSAFSMGSSSLNGLRTGSTRSKSSAVSLSGFSVSSVNGKAPLGALYEMLIGPMEAALKSGDSRREVRDLVLVLQGDLYLIPFSLLRKSQAMPALYDRFHLIAVPSVRALQASITRHRKNRANADSSGAIAIGNPKLPQAVIEQWQWSVLPGADQECRMISELLGCQTLTGASATKDNVLQQIQQPEVLHFITHVSWKLAALVLSSHGDFSTTSSVHGNLERMDLNDSNSEIDAAFNGPSLSEFLLTAADILNVKISAKLVVLNSGHSEDRAGRINSDGVVGLTRAFLAAGAQCVLFSLWPVPDLASRIFLRAFYTSLLQGAKTSQALSEAMRAVQTSKKFTHPSNWASWVLIGSDVKLSSKVAMMGNALCQLLKTPSNAREAMRVVLHLVEKSLQRMRMNQRSAMYTTIQSVENKVGDVEGWRDLLTSVGFRFEPGNNVLPAAVFFPTSDPGERLVQCSASLQALLGLAVPTLTALSKISEHYEVGEALTTLVREVNNKYSAGDANVEMPVSVRLWKAPGCHEFLASLGFDLVEVKSEEVVIKAGKQANRRMLHFALQALVAIFDTPDAPRTLLLDSSSSMESLASNGSCTSTSNFSKGSTPPTSPTFKKKSFFNPAEGKSSRAGSSRSLSSNISLHLTHQESIRRKYSSPSEEDESTRAFSVDMATRRDEDDSSISSNTGVPKQGSGRSRMLDRNNGSKGLFHQPPRHPYSTSASDSEDAGVPENNLFVSKSLSQSRSSLASQSSTITNKSTGSGSGFRRSKMRSSAASNRSTGSDRTITNEPEVQKNEEYVFDSRENFNYKPVNLENETTPLSVEVELKSTLKSNAQNLTDTVTVGVKKQTLYENSRGLDSGIDSQISQTSQSSPPQRHPRYDPSQSQTEHKLSQNNARGTDLPLPPAKTLPKTPTSLDKPVLPAKPKVTLSVATANSNIVKTSATQQSPNSINTFGVCSTSNFTNNSVPNSHWYNQGDTTEEENNVNDGVQKANAPLKATSDTKTPLDPTAVAHKVMQDTFIHKRSLDAMQQWSFTNMQQKRELSKDQTGVQEKRVVAEENQAIKHNEKASSLQGRKLEARMLESIDVSSTLSDSSMEKVPTPTQVPSHQPFVTAMQQDSRQNPQPTTVESSMKLPPPYPGLPVPPHLMQPSSNRNVIDNTVRPRQRAPILVNSLSDHSTTFTFANPMPNQRFHPDVQHEIIERQMNRLNESMPLAPIPENDTSNFNASSTDTDYEAIQSPPHGPVVSRPGALKTRTNRLMMGRQKVVKFKDEVDGNIESMSEESMNLSTKSSTEMNRIRQAMRRNLQSVGRYSDEESMSDSQSDLGSSMQSMSSSMSSREGSLRSALPPGLMQGVNPHLVHQKVHDIMQNKLPQYHRAPHHHNLPQSPTGSSSGTATPPYVPKLATPPYRVPGSPLGPQPNFQIPLSGSLGMPPSPGNQTPTRTGIPMGQHGPRQPSAGQMNRYSAPIGYRTPPQYGVNPATSAPLLPPRSRPGLAPPPHSGANMNGPNSNVPNGPVSHQNGPVLTHTNGPVEMHASDVNSPANLKLTAMNFYSSTEANHQRDDSSQHQQQYAQAPTSIPGRLPISSLIQNKGAASPKAVNGLPSPTASSGHFQYTPNQGRFQPMNRQLSNINLQHASSVESLQSYHSYQAYQQYAAQQGNYAHAPQTSKEWYHSDSEASIYSSAEEQMHIERLKFQADPRFYMQPPAQPMHTKMLPQTNQQQPQRGPQPQIASSVPQQPPPAVVRQMAYPVTAPHMRTDSTEDAWYKNTTDDELEHPNQVQGHVIRSMPNSVTSPQMGHVQRPMMSSQQSAMPTQNLTSQQSMMAQQNVMTHNPQMTTPQQMPLQARFPNTQRLAQPQQLIASTQNVARPMRANSVDNPVRHQGNHGFEYRPPQNQIRYHSGPSHAQTMTPQQTPMTSQNVTSPFAGHNSVKPASTSGTSASHNHCHSNGTHTADSNPLQNEHSIMSQLLYQKQHMIRQHSNDAPPVLPPRPTHHSMMSSQSEVISTENAVMSAENVGIGPAREDKWMPPKAQMMQEHQTRVGSLYRDMSLKTSQC